MIEFTVLAAYAFLSARAARAVKQPALERSLGRLGGVLLIGAGARLTVICEPESRCGRAGGYAPIPEENVSMPEGGGHLQGRPELTRYAGVRRAGPLLFVAGISSRQADNSIKGARSDGNGALFLDVRVQTQGAIENLQRTLHAHGASLSDVVDLTVFLTNMNDYSGFNEVYNRFFAASPPARTTIGVHELPDPALCIELKAIAYRPRRNRPVPEAI